MFSKWLCVHSSKPLKRMKPHLYLLCFLLIGIGCSATAQTYVGSTPAHATVREFLQISATDSIDFIRWKLELKPEKFTLQCQYGLSKPSTNGFSNEQRVAFEGKLTRSETGYQLTHHNKQLAIAELNANVLHLLDSSNGMLIGNGGYSYALNNASPVPTNEVHVRARPTNVSSPLVFEGRTPCNQIPGLLGITKSDACIKIKWYFQLHSDSLTGKPTYFQLAGNGYRKEHMARGTWQISTEPDGRIVYLLSFDQWSQPLRLLKGDDNILFFAGADGLPLVGNEDFSYTLNRRKAPYPRR